MMKKSIYLLFVGSLLLCCDNNTTKLNEPKPKEEVPEQSEQLEESEIIEIEMPCIREEPSWDYRVKNFTEEWNQLTTEERFENCQIPEDVLALLSTDDLADICMKNPLLIAWGNTFYHFEDGPDGLYENFNGVRELFQREDAYKALLKWYECALENLSCLYNESFVEELAQERAILTININIATLLLSRYVSKVDAKENYVEIVRQLVYGYEKMSEFAYPENETFCFLNYPNCFTRAKILIKIDESNLDKIPMGDQNPIFGNFIPLYFFLVEGKDCCDTNEETILIINELSYQIINSY